MILTNTKDQRPYATKVSLNDLIYPNFNGISTSYKQKMDKKGTILDYVIYTDE